jgi:hypothetical protein
MGELKATPGPWHWVDHGSFINVESKDCSSIASLFSYATPEIEEPNAHLIAAAPELYKALEHIQTYGWDFDICEAALAKARGET